MVVGWRSGTPQAIYAPPVSNPRVTSVLMLIAVWLFAAPYQPTRVRQYLRHPQLTGVALWSGSHLLSNGDSRSLALFGGLGIWALLEILLINRREGPWERPPVPELSVEVRGMLIAVVVFSVLFYLHPYFTGMPLFRQ
jgi:uncharacterized membrane protein